MAGTPTICFGKWEKNHWFIWNCAARTMFVSGVFRRNDSISKHRLKAFYDLTYVKEWGMKFTYLVNNVFYFSSINLIKFTFHFCFTKTSAWF